jgi:hypothetical protein
MEESLEQGRLGNKRDVRVFLDCPAEPHHAPRSPFDALDVGSEGREGVFARCVDLPVVVIVVDLGHWGSV